MPADQLQEYSLTSDYPHRSVSHNLLNLVINGPILIIFNYAKVQIKHRPQYEAVGNITTEFEIGLMLIKYRKHRRITRTCR